MIFVLMQMTGIGPNHYFFRLSFIYFNSGRKAQESAGHHFQMMMAEGATWVGSYPVL